LTEVPNTNHSTGVQAVSQFQRTLDAKMDFYQAQQQFAEFIKSASDKVNAYYWRLSGEAPNSLCKFLGVEEEELKTILRLCKVYNVDSNDNFSRNNFEMLMMMCKPHVDWVPYRHNLKPERFIRIGHGGEGLRPKDFYDSDGNLARYPVADEHIPSLRTKSQRSLLTTLLSAGRSAMKNNNEACDETMKTTSNQKTLPCKTISPKGMLLDYIRQLIVELGGSKKPSTRDWRTLQRLITTCVDVVAKELLHALIEKYAYVEQDEVDQAGLSALPDPVLSSATTDGVVGVVIEPVVDFGSPMSQSTGGPSTHPLAVVREETDPVILEFDNDNDGVEFGGDPTGGEDDQSVGSTTTNEF
jgi:hypothetical protein